MNRKELIDKVAEEWKLRAADNSGLNNLELFMYLNNCFNDTLLKEWEKNNGVQD